MTATPGELQILQPDGKTKNIRLEGERISLGRSSAGALCFPEDTGLSRQHLMLEREGDEWTVRDLNSKNGTLLNGVRLTTTSRLRPGDRITAGHLLLIYGDTAEIKTGPVVFVEGEA